MGFRSLIHPAQTINIQQLGECRNTKYSSQKQQKRKSVVGLSCLFIRTPCLWDYHSIQIQSIGLPLCVLFSHLCWSLVFPGGRVYTFPIRICKILDFKFFGCVSLPKGTDDAWKKIFSTDSDAKLQSTNVPVFSKIHKILIFVTIYLLNYSHHTADGFDTSHFPLASIYNCDSNNRGSEVQLLTKVREDFTITLTRE